MLALKEELIEDAADLVAKSFLNTPSYCEIFREKDEKLREEALKDLFLRNIKMMATIAPGTFNYHLDSEGKMDCFFMLVSKDIVPSLWDKISHGLLMIPFVAGWPAFFRLLKASDWFDEKEATIMKDRSSYLSLQRMVVRPDSQGKGLGSATLKTALIEVADKNQLPVYLGTQDPRNVIFYQRL